MSPGPEGERLAISCPEEEIYSSPLVEIKRNRLLSESRRRIQCRLFFFFPKVPFSRGIKLNRLSGAIDIVKKVLTALLMQWVETGLPKSLAPPPHLSFVITEAWCCHCIS